MKKYACVLLIIAFACDLIVEVDVPFNGEKLVVTSFFCPDSLWRATVSLNRHILAPDDEPFKRIENATVVVYDENGVVAALTHYGNGTYSSETNKPIPGKVYRLEVTTSSYGVAEATSTVPSAAVISSVVKETRGNGDFPDVKFVIRFSDAAQTNNYYHIRLESIEEYYDIVKKEIGTTTEIVPIVSDAPDLNSQFISADLGLLVNDRLFDGKETEIRFQPQHSSDLDYTSTIRITLCSISEEYYDYLSTLTLQQELNGNPIAQPINVKGNVVNGFGIFAGLATSVVEQSFPQPIITSLEPSSGKRGDIITIRGQHLLEPASPGLPHVYFTGEDHKFSASAQLHQQTDTYLNVVVPGNAVSGKILVGNNGEKLTVSDITFEVVN